MTVNDFGQAMFPKVMSQLCKDILLFIICLSGRCLAEMSLHELNLVHLLKSGSVLANWMYDRQNRYASNSVKSDEAVKIAFHLYSLNLGPCRLDTMLSPKHIKLTEPLLVGQ